jgi:hypothetical protein
MRKPHQPFHEVRCRARPGAVVEYGWGWGGRPVMRSHRRMARRSVPSVEQFPDQRPQRLRFSWSAIVGWAKEGGGDDLIAQCDRAAPSSHPGQRLAGALRFDVVMPQDHPPLGAPPTVQGMELQPALTGEQVVWAQEYGAFIPESPPSPPS